jgi:hypothetical protein
LQQAARSRNGSADYFPSRLFLPSRKRDGDLREGRFTSRIKIAGFRHPPLRFGRFRFSLRGAGPDRPPPFVAMKAAMGAVNPTKGSTP